MIIAVTGATGIVGRFVAADLAAAGRGVRALARPASDLTGYARDPEWVTGDLADEVSLNRLLQGADALVHCALQHRTGHYRGGEGEDPLSFWQANLLGTLAVLEAARRQGVARVVLLSSRAVFARRQPGQDAWRDPVSDDHPLWPDTHYGALKAASEALSGVYSAGGDMVVTALRPTGIYGLCHPPSRSKWFDIARAVVRGEQPGGTRIATEVHGADVAAAIRCLIDAAPEAVAGRAFNCSDLIVSRALISERLLHLWRHPDAPLPEMPEMTAATGLVRNVMSSGALRALGWHPGGARRLESTLRALLAAAADRSDPCD